MEFTYLGETDEACAPCRLRKICHGLERHRGYRVTEVRPVKHDVCTVFDGKVQVVGVEPQPWRLHVPVASLRGTMVTRRFEECGFRACPNRAACAPPGIPDGTRAEILKVGAKVECPAGRDLRATEVRKV